MDPSIWISPAQMEVKTNAKTRGGVTFLIGFQSPVIPTGLFRRNSVVMGWAESRLQSREDWFCEACKYVGLLATCKALL